MPESRADDDFGQHRATEGLHGIKVILFTAWAATVGPTDLRLADKLLAKPASRARLEQEVRDMLGISNHLQ